MGWSRYAAVGAACVLTSCLLTRNGTSDRCENDDDCAASETCVAGACEPRDAGTTPDGGRRDAGRVDAGPAPDGAIPLPDAGPRDGGDPLNPIDVWLILGEDNADGVLDEVPATAPALPVEAVRFYRRTQHESSYVGALDAVDPPDGENGNGVELSFGADLAAAGRNVAIFKFVHRDTSLATHWAPWGGIDNATFGGSGQNRGLYARVRQELAGFVAELAAEGYTPRIAGVVYMQWERDGRFAQLASGYEGRLRRLISILREDLGASLPVVLVRASSSQSAFDEFATIQAAQDAVAGADDLTTMVDPAGLPVSSSRYFTGDALMTLGENLAAHVLGLTWGTAPLSLPTVEDDPIVHRPATIAVDGDLGNTAYFSAGQLAGLLTGVWRVRVVPNFASDDPDVHDVLEVRVRYQSGEWRLLTTGAPAIVPAAHTAGEPIDLEVDVTGASPVLRVFVGGTSIGSATSTGSFAITGELQIGMRNGIAIFDGSIGPFSRP